MTEEQKEKGKEEFHKDLEIWKEDVEKWKKQYKITDADLKDKKIPRKDSEVTRPSRHRKQESQQKIKSKTAPKKPSASKGKKGKWFNTQIRQFYS